MMDSYWESIFSNSVVPPDHAFLPNIPKDVFIMGEKFTSYNDNDAIQKRLYSLYWMTYRKCFSPIGSSSGPTTDAGWGCMHRCSQMMLAEAIIRTKLGVDWRWTAGCSDEDYLKLCALFQDCTSALYSIHNITQTGVSVGKPIRSWFGPNTAVQVIKKLTAYDQWVDWAVHIAIEDGVIVDEIKSLCRRKRHADGSQLETRIDGKERSTLEARGNAMEEGPLLPHDLGCPPVGGFEQLASSPLPALATGIPVDPGSTSGDCAGGASNGHAAFSSSLASFDACAELIAPAPVMQDLEEDFLEVVIPPVVEQAAFADGGVENHEEGVESVKKKATRDDLGASVDQSAVPWRPLLLFIPLRLGLQTANPCYFQAIKGTLRIAQSAGILGGRPGHAFWIVGVVGEDDVLCLDPHEIQPATPEGAFTPDDDASHHCAKPILIPLTRLDPSLVLGFVCPTERDFDLLCEALAEHLLSPEASCGRPLFELHQRRPYNLPPIPKTARETAVHAPAEAPLVTMALSDVSSPGEEISREAPERDGFGVAVAESGPSQQLVTSLRLAGSHLTSGLRMLAPNAENLKSFYRRVVAEATGNGASLGSPVSADKLSTS